MAEHEVVTTTMQVNTFNLAARAPSPEIRSRHASIEADGVFPQFVGSLLSKWVMTFGVVGRTRPARLM
jgi:hypothetical protein